MPCQQIKGLIIKFNNRNSDVLFSTVENHSGSFFSPNSLKVLILSKKQMPSQDANQRVHCSLTLETTAHNSSYPDPKQPKYSLH